jgi:hypothetical protein
MRAVLPLPTDRVGDRVHPLESSDTTSFVGRVFGVFRFLLGSLFRAVEIGVERLRGKADGRGELQSPDLTSRTQLYVRFAIF